MDNENKANWNDMRFLLALERSGSALKAAKILRVSHQTVSRRLAELEKNLDARLVDRSGLNWQLTMVGQGVARQAQEIESSMRAAALGARTGTGDMAGRVRITSAGVGFEHFVMPNLQELWAEYPMIEFDMIADNAALDIQSGQFDIAVRFVKSAPGHLLGKSAGALEFGLFGVPELIEKLDEAIGNNSRADIASVVLLNQHLQTSTWLEQIVDPTSLVTKVSDLALMVQAVKNGLGVGFLPAIVAKKQSGMAECKSLQRKSPFDVWVLTNEDSRRSAKVRVVAKHFHRKILESLQQV